MSSDLGAGGPDIPYPTGALGAASDLGHGRGVVGVVAEPRQTAVLGGQNGLERIRFRK